MLVILFFTMVPTHSATFLVNVHKMKGDFVLVYEENTHSFRLIHNASGLEFDNHKLIIYFG